jgi:hypothetical protein
MRQFMLDKLIKLVQDQIATQLLGQQWSDSTPMVVRGDGNCLFNAIFLVLFGHENASSEVIDPRGLNVVFKILMFISAGPLTTGYTDLIGLPITVLAACMVHVHE